MHMVLNDQDFSLERVVLQRGSINKSYRLAAKYKYTTSITYVYGRKKGKKKIPTYVGYAMLKAW
jgi:hypothetical protein